MLKSDFISAGIVCTFGFLSSSTSVIADTESKPALIIDGAPTVLADNIQAYLGIAEESCVGDPIQQRLMLRKLNQNIQRAAQAIGYYHLQYTSDLIPTSDCWNLHLHVKPGEPVKIEHIDIQIIGEGQTDSAFLDYLKNDVPVKAGDQLDHGRYEKIKSDLAAIAAARGYFQAAFAISELRIDVNAYHADIILHYDSGPRLKFGEIRYPETILSPETLDHYTTFNIDDPYNANRLNELQRVLDASQYFTQVRVQPRPEEAIDGYVPVDVELTPRKQHAYRFGIGASTDTGPRAKFAYENRYLNDRGHRLNYDLTLSPVRSETKLNYSLPLSEPATQHLDIYTGFLTEETDTSKQDTFTLGAGYTRLTKGDWLQTTFLNFQRENFQVADTDETTNLLIPGISWSKIKSDDPLYPLYGWRMQAKLRAADESLGSDATFYQAYTAVKTVFKLGPGRVLLRLEAGMTEVDVFDTLPASVRYFAGGDNSVRGYEYQSLGPVNEEGEVVGGANLLVGSFEYDFRVSRQWSLAVFYDQGNAFNDAQVDYKRGAGIGLRWLSPIGPIRIDAASALDDNNEIRWHLSMGPDL